MSIQNLDNRFAIVDADGHPTDYFMRLVRDRKAVIDGKLEAPQPASDNAVVRFDGTDGQMQNSEVFIDDAGNVGIGTSTPATQFNLVSNNLASIASMTTDGVFSGNLDDIVVAVGPSLATIAVGAGSLFYQKTYVHEGLGYLGESQIGNNTFSYDHYNSSATYTGSNLFLSYGGYAATDVNFTNFGGVYARGGSKFGIGAIHSSFVLASNPTPAIFFDTSGNTVGINTVTPNANAALDVTSTTKAFMPPRMTTTQKNAIASPTAGMVVYDTTLSALCEYTTSWQTIVKGDTAVTPGSYTNTNLTVDAQGRITAASNGSGGGGGSGQWYWNPPTAASFTKISGDATVPTASDDSDIGMVINFQTLAAGTNVSRFVHRTLSTPSGDWVMTAHFVAAGFTTSRLFGLAMRDSVGGKSKAWAFRVDTTDQLARTNHTSMASGSTATTTNVVVTKNPGWLRMEKSGSNLNLYFSGDGKNWYLSFTESITAFLANVPDQVGFNCMYSSAAQQQYVAIDYFSLTGTAV